MHDASALSNNPGIRRKREFNQQIDKFSDQMLDLRSDKKLFVERSENETLADDCISAAACVVCCATNSAVDYSIPEDVVQ